jgi:hypothetical protein
MQLRGILSDLPFRPIVQRVLDFERLPERDKATGVKTRQDAMPRQTSRFGFNTGLFFVLFCLYVWLVIDPRLIHHSWLVIDPRLILHNIGMVRVYFPFSFATGWPLFWEHLARPGGLVEYGVRFLSQFYCFGWVGALIITGVAWYACLCTDILGRLGGRSRSTVLRYVPAILLLVMYGGYHHSLSAILSLLVALSCFLLYARLAPLGTAKRLAILPVTCAALYYAAGVGSLVFPVMVAVFELLIRRRMLVGVTALACGLVVSWMIGKTAFDFDVNEVCGCFQALGLGPWRGYCCVLVLGAFFPAVLAGTAVRRGVPGRRASRSPDRPSPRTDASKTGKAFRFPWRGKPNRTTQTTIVFVAFGAVAWYSLDGHTRMVLKIDYHCQHENWTAVLDAADGMSRTTFDMRCNRNILLALYHTGQLGDEMFRYRQRSLVDLFSEPKNIWNVGSYFQVSRLFLELGQVNMAEKYASEALEILGDLPAVLEHLATINIVKDRPETAAVFLNALSKNPVYRKTAKELLQRLEEDPRLENDPRIRKMRRAMVDKDRVASGMTVEDFLQALLEKDPHNKMAFEFLMAYYLCDRRPDQVVASMNRLEDLSYSKIPRHYQEAIIVHSGTSDGRLWIAGYPLDRGIIAKAEEAWKIMAMAPSPEEGASRGLAAGFGDTYFYYFLYGATGL